MQIRCELSVGKEQNNSFPLVFPSTVKLALRHLINEKVEDNGMLLYFPDKILERTKFHEFVLLPQIVVVVVGIIDG